MADTASSAFFTYTIGSAAIRCAIINGQRWFPVADVCKALGVIAGRRGHSRFVRAVDNEHKTLLNFYHPAGARPNLSVTAVGVDFLLSRVNGPSAESIRVVLLGGPDLAA